MEAKKIGLAICIILIVILALSTAILQGRINALSDENNALQGRINALSDENSALQGRINALQSQISSLKNFTYYVVDDAINISNVGIFREFESLDWYTINGTITNISDKPIKTIYVYLILRNPDGTADFSPYEYVTIENLYIGETEPFEFSYIYYNESQTVEILLIY